MEQHPGTAKHLCHMPYQHAKHKNPILIKFPHAYAVLARTLGKHQWVGTHAHTHTVTYAYVRVALGPLSLIRSSNLDTAVVVPQLSSMNFTCFLPYRFVFYARPLATAGGK